MQCGISSELYKSHDFIKITKIKPLADSEVSQGKLCKKGLDSLNIIQSEGRLKYPLLRQNGIAKTISWNEAYLWLCKTFSKLQETYGNESIGVQGGASLTNEDAYLLNKFARVVLQSSDINHATAQFQTFGIDRGLNLPLSEIPKAHCILLIGTNWMETHPLMVNYFNEAKRKGAKIIVVDPLETPTTRFGQMHLKINHGTDAILANGLLKVLMNKGYVNKTFVEARTEGFEAVRDHVNKTVLDDVVRLTGISLDELTRVARLYGEAKRAMIFTGRGLESQGINAAQSFINVALVTGKIGRDGCGFGVISEGTSSRQDESKLKGLLIMGAAPIAFNPSNLECLVVVDTMASEMTEMADLVLPGAAWPEKQGTKTNVEGRVQLNEAVIDPPGGARVEWKILCDIAHLLGYGEHFNFQSAEEVFNELRANSKGGVADYYGITYDKIRQQGGVFWPCKSGEDMGTPVVFQEKFETQSGRARLILKNDE